MENIRLKPAWPKSKETIWDERFAHLDECNERKTFIRRVPAWAYAAAAIVCAIFLTGSFYTVTEQTAKGEHAVVYLPDKSMVTLNAETALSYKPFLWFVYREVHLVAGEAYFEVKSGSRFGVHSGHNRTTVLGTIFNIYTRPGMYRVTCVTGQVRVQSDDESVVLNPTMQVTVREQKISFDNNIAPLTAIGWVEGKFDFVNMPLAEVMAEVERQYDIEVTADYNPNLLYSGNFTKTAHPEETLEIIGKAFGIVFAIK